MRTKRGRRSGKTKRRATRRTKRTFHISLPVSIRLGRARGADRGRSKRGVASGLRSRARNLAWSRLLSLSIAAAMVALLVWFFADLRFYVYEADVRGTLLVDANEVYRASDLDGLSIFYIDRGQVAERISKKVLGVVAAQVDCQLPSRVGIQVREREPRLIWRTGSTAFLVDGAGTVLKADDGLHEGLVAIRDLTNRPLEPGDAVDAVALSAANQLRHLLPEAMAFEYSSDKGISLVDARGWHVYFGDDQSLPQKVASMRAVLQRIVSQGRSAAVIDVRFVGSPYYQ